MSKVNLEPKLKTMTIEKTVSHEEKVSDQKSTYKAESASVWENIINGSPDMNAVVEAASTVEGDLEAAATAGALATGEKTVKEINKHNLTVQRPKKDAYLDIFEDVELPPSAIETAALLPENLDDKKAAIEQSDSYYQTYLDVCIERKLALEQSMRNGRVSPSDLEEMRQFYIKLEKGIDYIQQQKDAINKLKETL